MRDFLREILEGESPLDPLLERERPREPFRKVHLILHHLVIVPHSFAVFHLILCLLISYYNFKIAFLQVNPESCFNSTCIKFSGPVAQLVRAGDS